MGPRPHSLYFGGHVEKPTLIPIYLEAKSKKELVALMLKNNLTHGKHFKYFSPIKEGKNWVVWFYGDVEDRILSNEIKERNDN